MKTLRSEHSSSDGWMPALDGLRAIAVLSVVLFHFKTRHLLPGGGFGVDLFLALSGFLITTLLLREWRATGEINLRAFYIRRGLRLLPALLFFCGVYLFVMLGLRMFAFTGREDEWLILRSTGLALVYVWNWAIAFSVDYPHGVGHLWSLSLEEQFYLVWPFILCGLLRSTRDIRIVASVLVALIALSLLVPFVVIEGRLDPHEWRRVYYGSDFRAHGLLLGSLAAVFLAMAPSASRLATRWWFHALFMLAVFRIGMYYLTGDSHNLGMYTNLHFLQLSAWCSIAVLYAALLSSGPIWSLLTNPVLTYIGRRSYAIYLWHLPIGFWLRSFSELEQLLAGSLLSILAAELSYSLVERRAMALKGRFAAGRSPATGAPATVAPPALKTAEEAA